MGNINAIELLKELPFFEDFSDFEVSEIAALLKEKQLKKSDILIKQGDIGLSLYIIKDGKFDIVVEKESSNEKINTVMSGDIVGEMALLSDEPRNSTVIALRNSTVFELKKDDFKTLIEKKPSALLKITNTIIKRLNSVYKRHLIHKVGERQLIILMSANETISSNFFIEQCQFINNERTDIIFIDNQQLNLFEKSPFESIQYLDNLKKEHGTVVIVSNKINFEKAHFILDYADHIYLISKGDQTPDFFPEISMYLKSNNSPVNLILLHDDNITYPNKTKRWTSLNTFSNIHHVKPSNPNHIKRICRFFLNKAVGLSLAGGGSKGLAYLGMYKALEALNIPIDTLCGTSAGAIFLVPITFELNSTKIESIFYDFFPKLHLAAKEFTIPNFSINSGKKLNQIFIDLCKGFYIEDLWLNFSCPAVNFNKKELFYYKEGELWKALRCSASLPVLLPPLNINGNIYIDGGIINNMPVNHMRQHMLNGAGILFSFNVSSKKHTAIKYQSPEHLDFITHVKNYFSSEKIKLPNIIEILQETLSINSNITLEKEKRLSDFHIDLDGLNIGLSDTNLDKLKKLIPKGYETTMDCLKNNPILDRIPYYEKPRALDISIDNDANKESDEL